VQRGQQLLVHERAHLVREDLADLLDFFLLEQAVDSAEGLRRARGVDGAVDQVAGLGGVEGGLEGLVVAHLADQHDVRVFTHERAEGDLEVQAVDADLALVDRRLLVGEDVLDRVLDGDDVHGLALVHVVEHGGDRRGLARARHAAEQHDALRLHRDLGHDGGRYSSSKRRMLLVMRRAATGELAARLEEVHAEAVVVVVVVREVDRAELVQVLDLLVGEDVLRDRQNSSAGDRPSVSRGLSAPRRRSLGTWSDFMIRSEAFELDRGLAGTCPSASRAGRSSS
jgi:hypothetical protein